MSEVQKRGGQLHAIFALLLLAINCILGFIPILALGLLKLIPNQRLKLRITRMVDAIAIFWTDFNNLYINHIHPMQWQISGLDALTSQKWAVVIANHQSWLDIVILQRLLHRKVPVLKFFIKDQLKWVPLLGFAWWAMGCPFMKRYSKSYLEKYPHKKGQDLIATRQSLSLFKLQPTSIMNFVEGTRFTRDKKQAQQSPYQHLLKPKAGGVAFVISTLGEKIQSLLDVTIYYPQQQCSLWDFLCRRLQVVKIHIRQIELPARFITPTLTEDASMQSEFRQWLNGEWAIKDALLESMRA